MCGIGLGAVLKHTERQPVRIYGPAEVRKSSLHCGVK